MTANNAAFLRYFMIISVQKLEGDKIKYNRLPTQQENTKRTLKGQLK